MGALLTYLVTVNWKKLLEPIFLLATIAVIGFQHHELTRYKVSLDVAATVHQLDLARNDNLAKLVDRQNTAITALQTSQTKKEEAVEQAVVKAKVQEKKVAELLAPTNNKKPTSCEDSMTDVRNILKGLQ